MKKISTAEGKQARNFEDRQLTIGLDLGDRSSWYCVLDDVTPIMGPLGCSGHFAVRGDVTTAIGFNRQSGRRSGAIAC